MTDNIILILIGAAAAWYLVRRCKATLKNENPSCGCGGCDNCPAKPINIEKMPSSSRCSIEKDEK